MNKRFLFPLLGILMLAACQQDPASTEAEATQEAPASTYTEQHRPQFHFSPDSMWMNDPNGMVYYEGEYHLFYQYYPDSNVWGPMHWGHAISTDLVHWEHLPIALYPDSLGLIFSGSAVVDKNNSSGFKTGENDPLIAIFTHHLMEGEKAGRNDFQYQSIAYSNDKGRSWTKYEGNPVIPNPGIRDFRDPKVFWHDESQQWVMIFAARDHVRIYNSPDLKAWTLASTFGEEQGSHGGVWECPDLFELPVDGDAEQNGSQWMMIVSLGDGGPNGGSGTQYFLGQFDGKTFTNGFPKETIHWLDYGRDNYAGVTWSDIPAEDGRRLFMGWMSNWRYATRVPTERWRSAMTLPRSLELRSEGDSVGLRTRPVDELSKLRRTEKNITGPFKATESRTFDLGEGLVELILKVKTDSNLGINLQNKAGEIVRILYERRSNQYVIDRSTSGKVDFEEGFAGSHIAPRQLRSKTHDLHIFIDHSSVEIFADDGRIVMTDLFFPSKNYTRLVISANKKMEVLEGRLYELKSIW